ncbi:SLAM family member 5-like [Alosa pseudoharengus]|uniref:SLAM family member 5-like n=1 Tax=Alosa pseudoharengus TaxID=34774 RepID=UPI003F8C2D3B
MYIFLGLSYSLVQMFLKQQSSHSSHQTLGQGFCCPAGMMMSLALYFSILFLLDGNLGSQAISDKSVYGTKGGSITLPMDQLPEGTNITSVIWKHNQDKAAEWYEGEEAPTYFGFFNATTALDMETWALTISNLEPHFSGKYSAEVNHKDPTQSMTLAVICAVMHRGIGESITLSVDKSNVHTVQWMHNNTVIAQMDKGEPPSCLYDNMALDNKTFGLTISDLKLNATGIYEFKADGLDTTLYQIDVFDLVQKPIIIRYCNSTSCTLHCTGSNNTRYTWTDNKGHKVFGSVWVVEKSEHLDVIYTCNSSNPVSWKINRISERDILEFCRIGRHHWALVPVLLLAILLPLLIWRCSWVDCD